MEFAMPAGTVRFFEPKRGFGFVAPDDGGADIFIHISAVEASGLKSLNRDDFIEFDVERDSRTGKFIATNIEVVFPGAPTQNG
jgi:CspA family cold shock protein